MEPQLPTEIPNPDSPEARLRNFIPSSIAPRNIEAMRFWMGKNDDLTAAAKMAHIPTTDRHWGKYNEAQMREKLMVQALLEDLCSFVPQPVKTGRGRPPIPMGEMAFAIVSKVYEGLSTRRVNSDLQIAKDRGHLEHVPHFNTLVNYFNKPELVPVLTDLIQLSALPLKEFEQVFAIDASGLSSAFYSRWFLHKYGHDEIKDWIKIHLICGTKTNIVTAITVTEGTRHDSTQFEQLVNTTASHYDMKVLCADKGYLSRNNLQTAWDLGAVPLIPFKTNSQPKKGGSTAWREMYHYFKFASQHFYEHYNARSNVESTFSMIKRKFSSKVRSKNEVSRVNEALALVLCHNLAILAREMVFHGLAPKFEALKAELGAESPLNSSQKIGGVSQ